MEHKFLSEIKSVNNDGTITVYVSPNVVDRDHELISPDGWDFTNYKKNPVILSQHSWYGSLQNIIGKAIDMGYDEKGMWVTIEYLFGAGNDEADWAYYLAQKNLAAFSVGFITKERRDSEDVKISSIISKAELLEISQVLIPANQDATISQNSFVKTFKDFVESKNIEPKEEKEVEEAPAPITEAKAPEEKEIDPLKEIEEYLTQGDKE